jgi:hypothetical protein
MATSSWPTWWRTLVLPHRSSRPALLLLPDEITRLLAPLTAREAEILRLRFGLDHGEPRTLEEVGERFNLTRKRARSRYGPCRSCSTRRRIPVLTIC